MVSSRSFLDSFISCQQNDQTAYRPRHIVICYNRADARSFDIEFNTPCLDRHNTQPKFQLIEKDLLSSKSWVVYKETQEKRREDHRLLVIVPPARPNSSFSTISGHFFDNSLYIFHKTEVQTVILRC